MRGLAGGLAALLLALWCCAASAQGRGQPGDFDLYVLALSWSKGFCATNPDAHGTRQCSGNGLPGVLVHGLWPQYERGYPPRCDAEFGRIRDGDLGAAEAVMPSAGLARHEWMQHGTCSGLAPSTYFAAIARLHARYAAPLSRALPDDRTAPEDLKATLADVVGVPADAVQLVCRGGRNAAVLADIRICLTRDLSHPRACPSQMQRQDCRASQLLLDPG